MGTSGPYFFLRPFGLLWALWVSFRIFGLSLGPSDLLYFVGGFFSEISFRNLFCLQSFFEKKVFLRIFLTVLNFKRNIGNFFMFVVSEKRKFVKKIWGKFISEFFWVFSTIFLGRFDINESMITLLIPEIEGGILGVTEKKEKDWCWRFLVG